MISHQHKIIFIHIPKCAGSSIKDYYFNSPQLDWKTPNYDLLYGWCPKRKIHLQHATSKQLLETDNQANVALKHFQEAHELISSFHSSDPATK